MADEHNQMPVPPADFLFLVESLLVQTQINLGFLFGEGEEAPEPNLPMARHTIDMLAMLQEKTKGNLTIQEQRLLENGLTELRFRFVQVSDRLKDAGKPQEAPAEGKEEAPRIILGEGGKGTKSV
jgi:hypothetical protein